MKKNKLLVLGIARSGTSIIFKTLQTLFHHSSLKTIDVVYNNYTLDDKKDLTEQELDESVANHDLIGVFRETPQNLKSKTLKKVKVIFIVRDPRDCAMSWIHASRLHKDVPISNTIQDVISKNDYFNKELSSLLNYAENMKAEIYRYEDILIDPVNFLRESINGLDLNFRREAFDWAICEMNFLQTIRENNNHNRSGFPYQHKYLLSSEEQEFISKELHPVIKRLGYDKEPKISNLSNRLEIDIIKRLILMLAKENHDKSIIIESLNRRISMLEGRVL